MNSLVSIRLNNVTRSRKERRPHNSLYGLTHPGECPIRVSRLAHLSNSSGSLAEESFEFLRKGCSKTRRNSYQLVGEVGPCIVRFSAPIPAENVFDQGNHWRITGKYHMDAWHRAAKTSSLTTIQWNVQGSLVRSRMIEQRLRKRSDREHLMGDVIESRAWWTMAARLTFKFSPSDL